MTFEETGNTTHIKQDSTYSNRNSKKRYEIKDIDFQKIQAIDRDNAYPDANSAKESKDSKHSFDNIPLQMQSTFHKPKVPKQKSFKHSKFNWSPECKLLLRGRRAMSRMSNLCLMVKLRLDFQTQS